MLYEKGARRYNNNNAKLKRGGTVYATVYHIERAISEAVSVKKPGSEDEGSYRNAEVPAGATRSIVAVCTDGADRQMQAGLQLCKHFGIAEPTAVMSTGAGEIGLNLAHRQETGHYTPDLKRIAHLDHRLKRG